MLIPLAGYQRWVKACNKRRKALSRADTGCYCKECGSNLGLTIFRKKHDNKRNIRGSRSKNIH